MKQLKKKKEKRVNSTNRLKTRRDGGARKPWVLGLR